MESVQENCSKLSNEYRGDALTARALREFAVKNLPDDEVERIDSIDELKNVVSDDVPTLVYVTDKKARHRPC